MRKPMKSYSPEERELCARHEATHLVFAVILQARILNVGIPRADGRKPYNPLGRGPAKANNGYIDCFHVHEECDGFISLVLQKSQPGLNFGYRELGNVPVMH